MVPTLSVVVPAHNSGETLAACIASLVESERAPDELIVVDDASTERLDEMQGCGDVHWIRVKEGPRGPAYARNRGAESATGDILIFVDADVSVYPDTLSAIEREFMHRPELSALFGSYDDAPPAGGLVSQYKNLMHHYVHQQYGGKAHTFWAGCGAIRREVFRQFGGFDESFRRPSIEDIELGYRLSFSGHLILLCPHIQATHRKRWTLATMIRTDLFDRAVPWTRLIVRYRRIPPTLNVDRRSQIGAAVAWSFAATAVISLFRWAAAPLPVVLLLAQGMIHRRLYAFFRKTRGIPFLSGAFLLHGFYLMYSSLTFVLVRLWAAFEDPGSRGKSGGNELTKDGT